MADRERSEVNGKLSLRTTSGVKQDLKDIVSNVAQLMSPRPLKNRKDAVDSATDPRRQSTDHDY